MKYDTDNKNRVAIKMVNNKYEKEEQEDD